MRGALNQCPHCQSRQIHIVRDKTPQWIQCGDCLHVVEERWVRTREYLVISNTEITINVVTSDFAEAFSVPEDIQDDPFKASGFISAFSAMSPGQDVSYIALMSTQAGDLADMERVVEETLCGGAKLEDMATAADTEEDNSSDPEQPRKQRKEILSIKDSLQLVDPKPDKDSVVVTPLDLRNFLIAHYQMLDLAVQLNVEREVCDNGLALFHRCASQTNLRNRNIEALAAAAFYSALRQTPHQRSVQEIANTTEIPPKEITKYLNVLNGALESSQMPITNSLSVYLPRFCAMLGISYDVTELANAIGENVSRQALCYRRNPVSISAAAIYLASQLEDKKKTQTEICKITGLTEVTLRKVYKELIRHIDDILPEGYEPKVPPERAFASHPNIFAKSSSLGEEPEEKKEGSKDQQQGMFMPFPMFPFPYGSWDPSKDGPPDASKMSMANMNMNMNMATMARMASMSMAMAGMSQKDATQFPFMFPFPFMPPQQMQQMAASSSGSAGGAAAASGKSKDEEADDPERDAKRRDAKDGGSKKKDDKDREKKKEKEEEETERKEDKGRGRSRSRKRPVVHADVASAEEVKLGKNAMLEEAKPSGKGKRDESGDKDKDKDRDDGEKDSAPATTAKGRRGARARKLAPATATLATEESTQPKPRQKGKPKAPVRVWDSEPGEGDAAKVAEKEGKPAEKDRRRNKDSDDEKDEDAGNSSSGESSKEERDEKGWKESKDTSSQNNQGMRGMPYMPFPFFMPPSGGGKPEPSQPQMMFPFFPAFPGSAEKQHDQPKEKKGRDGGSSSSTGKGDERSPDPSSSANPFMFMPPFFPFFQMPKAKDQDDSSDEKEKKPSSSASKKKSLPSLSGDREEPLWARNWADGSGRPGYAASSGSSRSRRGGRGKTPRSRARAREGPGRSSASPAASSANPGRYPYPARSKQGWSRGRGSVAGGPSSYGVAPGTLGTGHVPPGSAGFSPGFPQSVPHSLPAYAHNPAVGRGMMPSHPDMGAYPTQLPPSSAIPSGEIPHALPAGNSKYPGLPMGVGGTGAMMGMMSRPATTSTPYGTAPALGAPIPGLPTSSPGLVTSTAGPLPGPVGSVPRVGVKPYPVSYTTSIPTPAGHSPSGSMHSSSFTTTIPVGSTKASSLNKSTSSSGAGPSSGPKPAAPRPEGEADTKGKGLVPSDSSSPSPKTTSESKEAEKQSSTSGAASAPKTTAIPASGSGPNSSSGPSSASATSAPSPNSASASRAPRRTYGRRSRPMPPIPTALTKHNPVNPAFYPGAPYPSHTPVLQPDTAPMWYHPTTSTNRPTPGLGGSFGSPQGARPGPNRPSATKSAVSQSQGYSVGTVPQYQTSIPLPSASSPSHSSPKTHSSPIIGQGSLARGGPATSSSLLSSPSASRPSQKGSGSTNAADAQPAAQPASLKRKVSSDASASSPPPSKRQAVQGSE
eukprot:Rmarinus@m.22164